MSKTPQSYHFLKLKIKSQIRYLSPKQQTLEEVGLAFGIGGDISYQELLALVEEDLQEGKWNGRHTEVHENVVAGAEGNVEWVEVGTGQSQQGLRGDSEDLERVVKTLVHQ